MSFKACIFDLDGTLCDSVESVAYSANHMMRDLGLKEAPVENFKYYIGDGVDMLIHRLLHFAGDDEEVNFDRARELYVNYFADGCLYNIKSYPGIPEAVEELKKAGAKISVFSNKPNENTQKVINKVFGPGVFDWIQGQSDKFPRKPAPDGALYIAEHLGVTPDECMYMGDTGTDMQTGSAAKMYTIGVLWGFRDEKELRENGADCIISDPMMLPEIFRRGE